MTFFLIRHLPTLWNERTLLQGRRDVAILHPSAESAVRIQRNHQLLKQHGPFDVTLVSSLRRTHQTALQYGFADFVVEPLLDELDFGSFEGCTRAQLVKTLGTRWHDDPRELTLGESLANLDSRISSFLGKYETASTLLAFCHGAWLRALVSKIRRGDLRSMNLVEVENNSICAVDAARRSVEFL